MPHHSLRWKAIASLLATAALLGVATAFWRVDARPTIPSLPPTGLPPLLLAAPHVERDARGGRIDTVVLRTAPHLAGSVDPAALVERLRRQGVRRVWVQCKQDETDEFTGGELFLPSALAPVAAGFEDGRLWKFVDALRAAGLEVAAWVPAFNDRQAATRHPEWRAHRLREDGTSEPQADWLCPRNPGAVAYEASVLGEIAKLAAGRFAAIYTDFIRYDDDFSCACPRCLGALQERVGGAPIDGSRLLAAAKKDSALWKSWTRLRSQAIRAALDEMREAIDAAAPDLWFGACVLPFSAQDYALNTQSGQDLRAMCRAGVDELVLMGYWDDWDKSPAWLAESIACARELVGDEARLSVLLDGDMSLRTTLATLGALHGESDQAAWFQYGEWTDESFTTLHHARRLWTRYGGVPRAPFTAVTIRVDTEPDYRLRYETVGPEMIGTLLELFAREHVHATFITCGRIAELQQPILARAQAEGHEIGSHGYNHEQLDALPEDEQLAVIDRSLAVLRERGFVVDGFGAPRNSITPAARQRLIHHGLFYDGSAAYDPLKSYTGPELVRADDDPRRGIVVLPFIMPNDWDARFVADQSADEMAAAWLRRLDRVAASGEPCFVLDIHQWIAAQPDNLQAVRTFIRAAKARGDCRVLPLRATARHTLTEILRLEDAAHTQLTAKEDK